MSESSNGSPAPAGMFKARPPTISAVELETVRLLVVDLMLAWRQQFLAGGGSALKQWEQIETRMVSAAKRSSGPMEWPTLVARGLRLPGPSKATSSAMLALVRHVDGLCSVGVLTPDRFLGLIEAERGLLVALAREAVEKRREARDAVDREHFESITMTLPKA